MNPAQRSTRRSLLGFMAAAPAVIALPASAATLAACNPDTALLELERQRVIAAADYERLSIRADELHTQARAMFPAKPEALRARRSDWFGWHGAHVDASGYYSAHGLQLWRDALERPEAFVVSMLAPHDERGREILAAAQAHAEACESVYIASGARHASDLSDAAGAVLGDLEDRILTTRASTREGLAIKARMAAHIMGDEADGTREDFAARGLLADLLKGT